MIEIEQVSKAYAGGRVRAVDDLTLTVPSGEIFGFLGPNGAGKTTTIKMIVGILNADRGSIRIEGIDTRRDPLKCKSLIAYVPDSPDIYEKLTGLEYLNFIGDVYGVTRNDRLERIREWLEMFELAGAVRNPIQSYSHGMRQKIVLIAALMVSPRVLILDEPMVGLDPKSARSLKDAMRRHCDEGGTLFFSTHIMETAERLCDHLAIIHKGKLIADGHFADLRQRAGENRTLEEIFLELTR